MRTYCTAGIAALAHWLTPAVWKKAPAARAFYVARHQRDKRPAVKTLALNRKIR